MKRIIVSIFYVVVCLLLLSSCAKEKEMSNDEKQRMSLKAWIDLYGDGAEEQPSGLYIKKLYSNPDPKASSPKQGYWVQVNYTCRTLDGDVFATRDSTVTRMQGTFRSYTHYDPEYFSLYRGSGHYFQTPPGAYEALLQMKEGDKWRLYMPSSLGYGEYGLAPDNGYEGQYELGENMPIIIDLELVKVMQYPVVYEEDQVMAYAMQKWNMSPTDTVKSNIYVHSVYSIGDTATVKYNKTAEVYYVGRFLDGFVFDTNIADTAKKYNMYVPDRLNSDGENYYQPRTIDFTDFLENPNGSELEYISGFYYSLLTMKYGETATAVFTSSYAYGYAGSYDDNRTVIQPYTPLMFDLITVAKGGEGTPDLPYFVYGVLNFSGVALNVWVTGYVVGVVDGDSVLDDSKFEEPFTTKTNILIADQPDEKRANYVVAIELPEGSQFANALNLVDNPDLLGKRIRVIGDIRYYLGVNGVINITGYSIEE